MSKLRLLTVFSAHAAFPVPALPSGLTSFLARSRMGPPPLFALDQRARVISRTTRSHIERSTAPFPRRESCFPSNNNRDVESMFALTRAGHDHDAWPRRTRSHETNPFSQGHCSVKPSPFHPNAEAVTVLAHMFARLGEVDKHACNAPHTSTQFQHVTRPSTCSTSLTSLACAARLCICTRQRCAHWQRLTSIVTSLLGRMPWVLTQRHRTMHPWRVTRFPARRVTESGVREPSSPTRTQKPKSCGNDHREPVWPRRRVS